MEFFLANERNGRENKDSEEREEGYHIMEVTHKEMDTEEKQGESSRGRK